MSVLKTIATVGAAAMLALSCGGDPDATSTAAAAATSPPEAVDGTAPAGPVVRPGRANWATGYFQAAVYAALLEELGFVVADPAEHEYPPAEAYSVMAEGTFDFWANGWYSQHETWLQREMADGSMVGDHLVVLGQQVPGAALEGLVITKAVADTEGIASLAQINDDPALAALFDTDGDGLGEIHGCPEAWTCDDIIDEMIAFNGWTNLEQVKAEYPGLVASSIAKVQADEPVIQYIWSPSGHLGALAPGETVLWLSVGDNAFVLDGTTPGGFDFAFAPAAPFVDECTEDPCWIGWEVSDIQVTANQRFIEANPRAGALFEVVRLPLEDIVAQNIRFEAGENTDEDVRRHADEWIAANRALVDVWLVDARAS